MENKVISILTVRGVAHSIHKVYNGFSSDFETDYPNFTGTVEFEIFNRVTYYVDGKVHREDGHAIIWADGEYYCWEGRKISKEEWLIKVREKKLSTFLKES